MYMYIIISQNANKMQATDQDQLSLLNIGSIVIRVLVFMMFLVLFAVHCTWVTSSAYSSPSVLLASQNSDG